MNVTQGTHLGTSWYFLRNYVHEWTNISNSNLERIWLPWMTQPTPRPHPGMRTGIMPLSE